MQKLHVVSTENRQFRKFIIFTIILPRTHDSAICWRKIKEHFRRPPFLDDLRPLIEFAQAGPIAGASDRLSRTPPAITRQLQRLEAALGAELLDRSVKPPRLNSLGSRVLEQARDLLRRAEKPKTLTSSPAQTPAPFRTRLPPPLAPR